MECDVLNEKINSGLIRKLKTDGFAVYSMLVAHRDELNLTSISSAEISRLTGLATSTVRDRIKDLVNLNIVKVEKTAIGLQNVYEVTPDSLKEINFEEENAKRFFIERVPELVRRTLKRNNFGYKPSGEYHTFLGCTREEYADYLESKFTNGMTFANKEKWQIDHIISLSTASDIPEFIKLCHYTNTRPMWTLENLKKGSGIIRRLSPEQTMLLHSKVANKPEIWRIGQAYFNYLSEIDKELADSIQNLELNPFYNDGNLPAFFNYLMEIK